jgi:hypothetical protein
VETKKNGCVRYQNSNHVAQLKESYNIKGLLPAPLMHTKIIALSGYKTLSPFIYLYTITTTNFFSGNKKD